MKATQQYRHSGLQIESEVPLPEWAAFEAPHCFKPDLRITLSPRPHSQGENTFIDADSYCFFVPDAAQYRVHRGGEIEILTVTDPDMKKVRVCLYGMAWAAFFALRGLSLLHGSAVSIEGKAVAFCGPSGAGKSSLTAQLTTAGFPLISDDLFRVELGTSGLPSVYPSSTRLKLWREALPLLSITHEGLEQDHSRMNKFHVPLSDTSVPGRLPLAALFVLTWGEPACTRLRGMDALRRLVGAATYRGDLLEAMNDLARHWACCAELTRRIPIWELSRPRDWAKVEETAALLLTKLQLNSA